MAIHLCTETKNGDTNTAKVMTEGNEIQSIYFPVFVSRWVGEIICDARTWS